MDIEITLTEALFASQYEKPKAIILVYMNRKEEFGTGIQKDTEMFVFFSFFFATRSLCFYLFLSCVSFSNMLKWSYEKISQNVLKTAQPHTHFELTKHF